MTRNNTMEAAMASDPVFDEDYVHPVDPTSVSDVLRGSRLGALATVESYPPDMSSAPVTPVAEQV